jgi:uncharacterized BrkB/YihY/UPF0761 family membrane protein
MLDNDHSIGPITDITNNVVHMKSWKYIYIYIYIYIFVCVYIYIPSNKKKTEKMRSAVFKERDI